VRKLATLYKNIIIQKLTRFVSENKEEKSGMGFNTRKSKNKKCTKITLSYFFGIFFRRLFYWKNFFCLGALNNNNNK
jgi:hypothetical protein